MDTKLKVQYYEIVCWMVSHNSADEKFFNEEDALNRCAVLADAGVYFDLLKIQQAILDKCK